jgi:hypothetical protein
MLGPTRGGGLLPRFSGLAETNCGGPVFAPAPLGGTRRHPAEGRTTAGTIIITRDSWRMMTPSNGTTAVSPSPAPLRSPLQQPSLGVLPNATPAKNYCLGVDMRMPLPPPPKTLKIIK